MPTLAFFAAAVITITSFSSGSTKIDWPAIQALGHAMDPDNRLYGGADAAQSLPEDLLERWLGVPLDSPMRAQAGVRHALALWSEQGHCYSQRARLSEMAAKLLEIPESVIGQAIDAEIARIVRDGVTDDELERAKTRFRRGVIFARDNSSGMANLYGGALATGLTMKDIDEWPQRIEAVTARQVQDVAAKYLVPGKSVAGYLLPQDFWPAGTSGSVQASYATQFFTPSVALGGDFQVIGPDGRPGVLSGVEVGSDAAALTVSMPDQGTYLLTTGEQMGRVTTLVGTPDGQWRPLGQGETPPADAQTNTLQTVTVSSVYLTRGVPNRTAVDHTVGRLAIHPIGDPSQIVQANGFQVELLFDGQPFPSMPLVIYASGDPDTKLDRYVVTGADGRATLSFDQPGRYVVAVRHRANAPAGSAATIQSYTTTLTIDVMAAQHALAPAEQATQQRPRRRLITPGH